MKERPHSNQINHLLGLYLSAIALLTTLICYLSYRYNESEIILNMDMSLLRLEAECASTVENFWDAYLPIFETDNAVVARKYFLEDTPLDPYSIRELREVLQNIAQRNNRIRWVAIYSPARDVNYIFRVENNVFQALPADFPYLEDLAAKSSSLEIYGSHDDKKEIVLAGGTPVGSGKGSLLIGHDAAALYQLAESNRSLPGEAFGIIWENTCIAGDGKILELTEKLPAAGSHTLVSDTGSKFFVSVSDKTPQGTRVLYTVPYKEIVLYSLRFTPAMLLVAAAMLAISLGSYTFSMRGINREMTQLRRGLHEIGNNNLSYRFTEPFHQSDFARIAESINAMAQDLQDNVKRAQIYQKKQRDAEIQELQAKFNPHFLYNSLEMFQSRCYENGDEETADLIADTAAIFRGFINPRTFIPLREEMAFSSRYLSLFRARYGDSVQILYDMDPAAMEYGIIRNVFQPIIENYFVHGIDTSRDDNVLCFRARIVREDMMRITVEDNGHGLAQEKLQELNAKLQEPIGSEKESYGLKNLSQRIRLFYGEKYGLALRANPQGGLILEMNVACWTCDKVEREKPEF